jgi:hypothetical protein
MALDASQLLLPLCLGSCVACPVRGGHKLFLLGLTDHTPPPLAAQLMSTPDNPSSPWSAAAWIGLTRSSSNSAQWLDLKGTTLNYVPWCPGEPNYKYGTESCTNLLTYCGGGSALVNDYDCSRPLRVLCAFQSSGCGELRLHV